MNARLLSVGGACFLLDIDGVLRVGCDPALSAEGTTLDFRFFSSQRRRAPRFRADELAAVDVWLITHGHADHLDAEGVRAIGSGSRVITDVTARRALSRGACTNVTTLAWGETVSFERGPYSMTVEAVRAHHGSNWLARALAGRVNGYYLQISKDGEMLVLYVTSDTVLHPRVLDPMRGRRIDVLVANLGGVLAGRWGGPLTMTPGMLRRMVSELKPKEVVPLHCDDFSHYTTTVAQLEGEGFTRRPHGTWFDVGAAAPHARTR